MKAFWDDERFSYVIDGAAVDELVAKAAGAGVSSEFNANIRVLSDRLMGGQISLDEWYAGMKREVKFLHMAEAALSRGGFDQMRPQDWARVEQIVEAQWSGVEGEFPGLRAFAEDIAKGRYGTDVLARGVLSRAGQYADAGRATYENERMASRMEAGAMESRRVRGYVDGCADCVAWARLGWIPAEEMMAKYPISASQCGSRCYCIIQMRPALTRTKTEIPRALKVAAGVAAGAIVVGGALAGVPRPIRN